MPDITQSKSTGAGGKRPGAGRPPGALNKKTKEDRLQEEAMINKIKEHADELIQAQLLLAKGASYVYRIDEEKDAKGNVKKREHVLVTDPEEILRYLNDETEDEYYYISTHAPNATAIKDTLDRAYGKAAQSLNVKGNLNIGQLLDSFDEDEDDESDTNAKKDVDKGTKEKTKE